MRNATSRKLIDNHRWDFLRILVRFFVPFRIYLFNLQNFVAAKYVLIDEEVCCVVCGTRPQVLFSLSDRWKKNNTNSFFRRKYIKWIWCGICWTCAMKPHQMNGINRPMNCFLFKCRYWFLLSGGLPHKNQVNGQFKVLQWMGKRKNERMKKARNDGKNKLRRIDGVSQFNGFESDGFTTIPYVPMIHPAI